MRQRWRLGLGFVVLGALVGIGIIPARRRMTVQVREPTRHTRRAKPRRRVGLLRHLFRLG